jgi:hypothetical protein
MRVMTAKEVAATLGESLAKGKDGETYRLGILRIEGGKVGGGHALTPYKLVNAGGNKWKVGVYDSNHPDEERVVEIDADADTWSYVASTNPAEPEGQYGGGPGTMNPMYPTPNSVRLGKHPCDFCTGGSKGQSAGFGGALDVTAEDDSAKKAGPGPSGLTSEIAGMKVHPSFSDAGYWRDDAPYRFRADAPKPLTFTAKSKKKGLKGLDDQISITSYRPGGVAAVRGRGLGGNHTMKVPGDGEVRYTSDTVNVGPVELAVRGAKGGFAKVAVEVGNSSPASTGVSIDPASQKATVAVGVGGKSKVRLAIKTLDAIGTVNSVVLLMPEVEKGTLGFDATKARTGESVTVTVTPEGGKPTDVDVPACDPVKCPPLSPVEGDADGDVVPDDQDDCPQVYDPEQADLDKDGIGDACDPDKDGDGVDANVDCDDYDPKKKSCACDAGSWDDDGVPSTACKTCDAGTYCAGGAAQPEACASPTWDDDASAKTACVAWSDCKAGTYVAADGSATKDRDCAACDAGKWSGQSNAATCDAWTSCKAGEYEATPGSASADAVCSACVAGQYCAGGETPPETCADSGKVDDDSDPSTPCVAAVAWSATWSSAAGSSQRAMDVATDAAGNAYVLTSYITSMEVGGNGYTSSLLGGLLISYDSKGALRWVSNFHTNAVGDAFVRRMVIDPVTGDLFVAGDGDGANLQVGPTDVGAQDVNGSMFVARIKAADGSLVWGKTYPTSSSSSATALALDGAGSLVVAGAFQGSLDLGGKTLSGTPANSDGFLAKLATADGTATMLVSVADDPTGLESPRGVAVLSGGDIAVVGMSDSGARVGGQSLPKGVGLDAFYARFTAAGALVHAHSIATPNDETIDDVHAGPNDAYFLSGSYSTTVTIGATTLSNGTPGSFLARIDAAGAVAWASGLEHGSTEKGLRRFAVAANGNVRFAGDMRPDAQGTFGGKSVPAVVKQETTQVLEIDGATGKTLSLLALLAVGSQGFEGYAIGLAPDGKAIIAGTFDTTCSVAGQSLVANGAYGEYLMKLTY